jgi:hypothetical protein
MLLSVANGAIAWNLADSVFSPFRKDVRHAGVRPQDLSPSKTSGVMGLEPKMSIWADFPMNSP